MSDFLRGNAPEYVRGRIIAISLQSKASSKSTGIRPNVLLGKEFNASWGSWTYSRLIGEESVEGQYLIEGILDNGKYFQLTKATIERVNE